MAQPIRAMCQSHDIIDWEKQQNVSLLNHVDLLKYRSMHYSFNDL